MAKIKKHGRPPMQQSGHPEHQMPPPEFDGAPAPAPAGPPVGGLPMGGSPQGAPM